MIQSVLQIHPELGLRREPLRSLNERRKSLFHPEAIKKSTVNPTEERRSDNMTTPMRVDPKTVLRVPYEGTTPLHELCKNKCLTLDLLSTYFTYAAEAASLPSLGGQEKLPLHHLCGNVNVSATVVSCYINIYQDSMLFKDGSGTQPRQILWSNEIWKKQFLQCTPKILNLLKSFFSVYAARNRRYDEEDQATRETSNSHRPHFKVAPMLVKQNKVVLSAENPRDEWSKPSLHPHLREILSLIIRCPSIARVRGSTGDSVNDLVATTLEDMRRGLKHFKTGFRAIQEKMKLIGTTAVFHNSSFHISEATRTEKACLGAMRTLLYTSLLYYVDKFCEQASGTTTSSLETISALQQAICENDSVKEYTVGDKQFGSNQSPHGWEDVTETYPITGLKDLLEHDDEWGESDTSHPMPYLVSPLAHAVRLGNVECVEVMCRSGANGFGEGVYLKQAAQLSKFCKACENCVDIDVQLDSRLISFTPYHVALCGSRMIKSHYTDSAMEAQWEQKTWFRMLDAMQVSKGVEKGRRTIACRHATRSLCVSFIVILVLVFSNIYMSTLADSSSLRFHKSTALGALTSKAADISSPEEAYDWLESSTFIDTLFAPAIGKPAMVDKVNYVIGAIRLHQVRHATGQCPTQVEALEELVGNTCVLPGVEETKPIGPINPDMERNRNGFQYLVGKSKTPITVFGARNGGDYNYPKGGYIVDLHPEKKNDATAAIKLLKTHNWIDPSNGTGSVHVFFSVYNKNTQLMATSRISMEFWSSGGTNIVSKLWVIQWRSRVRQVMTSLSIMSTLVVFVLFFFNEFTACWKGHVRNVVNDLLDDTEAYQKAQLHETHWGASLYWRIHITLFGCWTFRRGKGGRGTFFGACSRYLHGARKNPYFQDPWNLLEVIICIYFFRAYNYYALAVDAREEVYRSIQTSAKDPSHFVDLNDLSFFEYNLRDHLALLLVFVFIHALKAIQKIPYFGIGYRTLAITNTIVSPAIIPFYIVLGFLICGFSLGFFFSFGDEVGEYHDLLTVFWAVFMMNTGQDPQAADTLLSANWLSSIAMFSLISFLLTVVLMNIFIAVVSEVYTEEMAEAMLRFNERIDDYVMSLMETTRTDMKNREGMTLATAIKKTIRTAAISSIERTKQKAQSIGETREETMRRVIPDILKAAQHTRGANKPILMSGAHHYEI